MSDPTNHHVALALGSNIGDRLSALQAAKTQLSAYVNITAVSHVYETLPAYVTDQPAFLNAVVLGTTALEPLALLWTVKAMESTIGRQPTFRYGPRVIDIDILFLNDIVMDTPELVLPHRRMGERDFVLRPLCDIASEWRHPHTGQTARDMLGQLTDTHMIDMGPFK